MTGGGGGGINDDNAFSHKYNNPDNNIFAPTITLDGFFLFVQYDVWKNNCFDEKLFHGFHFYDSDFALQVALTRQNYVCLAVDIYHFSHGNPNQLYYEDACTFQKKWKCKLPYSLNKNVKLKREFALSSALLLRFIKYRHSVEKCISHIIEINGCLFIIPLVFYTFCKGILKLLLKPIGLSQK